MILNLGCGASRPKDPEWINVDDLHSVFPNPDCKERQMMDAESNYKNFDIRQPLWLQDGTVDAILASNILEHFDVQRALAILRDWHRVLKPGGVLRLSVPDPHRFWSIEESKTEDWGEPNFSLKTNHPMSFTEYALFFTDHKQCICRETAFCMLYVVGFSKFEEVPFGKSCHPKLASIDNRPKFCLFVEAIK